MSFNVLVPMQITDAMITSCSISEPAPGEAMWISGGTYTLEQEVVSSVTHKIYSSLIAHTGRTIDPSLDLSYWNDERPSNKFAPFDLTISTACAIVTPYTCVLRPGFFNSIRFYGLNGASISLTIKDSPGGTVVFDTGTVNLINDPLDWYDWAFGRVKQKEKYSVSDLTPYPDPEVTITISAGVGITVGVGMIAIGDYRSYLDGAEWGGAECGASAELVNFSQIDVNKYGDLKIIDGRKANDMRVTVKMPQPAAEYFFDSASDALSTPCAVVATDAPGYSPLDVFGLASGAMTFDSFGVATFNCYIKGLV